MNKINKYILLISALVLISSLAAQAYEPYYTGSYNYIENPTTTMIASSLSPDNTSMNSPANATDANWSTSTWTASAKQILLNYTLNATPSTIVWQMRWGNSSTNLTENVTIPNICIDGSQINLLIDFAYPQRFTARCRNFSSNSVTTLNQYATINSWVGANTAPTFFEEGVYYTPRIYNPNSDLWSGQNGTTEHFLVIILLFVMVAGASFAMYSGSLTLTVGIIIALSFAILIVRSIL